MYFFNFFFNDTATTEIYTLSLHDALPILPPPFAERSARRASSPCRLRRASKRARRSEEHTSELQSRFDLVCRLLLEKKKKNNFSSRSHSVRTSTQLTSSHSINNSVVSVAC